MPYFPASDSKTQLRRPHSLLAVCGLLLLAVALVFGQTVRHEFINLDDADYVYQNQRVRAGLTGEGIVWAFTQSHVSNWHPLTWLSLMADAQMLKPREGPLDLARLAAEMHLVNVALHAANSLVLFLVLTGMTASIWRSALVAALFAVHPLHVESVAWVTERKDVLSGLFGLLAIGAYAWYARGPTVGRYLLVAAALTLGLTAKSMLVTWPLLLLLLDYWPLQRQFSVRLVLEKVPLLLPVAASAAITFLAHRSGGAVISLASVPISERIARAAVLYVTYFGKTLWPVNLTAMYPKAPIENYWPALAAGVLLVLLTAGALWGARRGQRWLAVGWFWYLGTLAPTIGLVQVGSQVMADRFLYLPQIGICLSMVWGAAHLAGVWPFRRRLLAAVSALLVGGLMVCAWQQTSYWRISETLWTHALACTSQNRMAHYNLGVALVDRRRVDEAISEYQKALDIKPDYAEAHNNLGVALANRGQFDEAIAHYRNALEIKPDYGQAYTNLGNALADRGQVKEAIVQYRKALQVKPDDMDAHNNLGLALADGGQFDEATACFCKSLEINPYCAEAHYNLGLVLAGRKRIEEAIAHYRQALDLARQQNNQALAESIQAKLRLYQPPTPLREPSRAPAKTPIQP